MKNPFEELPELPSQPRHHRLRFFPWEEATEHVPQLNGVRQPARGQVASEAVQQPSQLGGIRQPEEGQAVAEPARRMPLLNGISRPEGGPPLSEAGQRPSQFNGIRQPDREQAASETARRPSQFNGIRQPIVEPTRRMPQVNGTRRPDGGSLVSENVRQPLQFNGIRQPEGRRAEEPTQRLSQFSSMRPPESDQGVTEQRRRMSQVNGVRQPGRGQGVAEPLRAMPQVSEIRRPQTGQVAPQPMQRISQVNGVGRQEVERTLSAAPLRLPARGQPIIDRFEKRPGSANLYTDDDHDLDKLATIPVMVLRNIAKQQGASQPAMKSELSEAASSAGYVSIGNIGGTILKYGSNLVIQRGFGAAGFGLYSLSLSLVTLMAAIFHLGLDDAMVRYVSIYRTKKQASSLRGLAIFCSSIVAASGIIGAGFVFFLAPWLAIVRHSPDVIPLLQVMTPMVPLMTMQTIWINGLQGFKEFRWRVLLQRILMPVVLIVLLLGTVFLFHDLEMIAIALLVNTAIATTLSLFFFFRKITTVAQSAGTEYQLRDWFGFAAPNFLTSILDTVLESVDTLLLAYFAISNTGLGQYAAAIKISGFILMPQASFNAMFAPTIAELHSKGEQQKLEAMFKVVTKWAMTFSLPIFGIGTLFAPYLLAISGDHKFIDAWPLAVAFCIGTMINVSTGSVGYMLLMTGHQKISFLNSLTAVLVNVGVGCILAPRHDALGGAMGVAIATGMAVSVVNIMRLLQVRVLLKMQPYRWDVLKPMVAWVVSALFIGSLLYLLELLHLSIQIFGFYLQLSLIPAFLAIYVGLLVLFKVSPEDQVVLDMLRRKFMRGKKNKNKNRKR